MAWDPDLLKSLEAAVEQAPDQVALRLHVSRLYADGGRWIESGSHAEAVLNREPANLEALDLAAQASEHLGQDQRAEGFRRLHQALSGPAARQTENGSPLVETPEGSDPTPSPDWGPASNHPSRIDPQFPPGLVPPRPLAAGPVGPIDPDSIDEAAIDAFLEEVLGNDPDIERPKVTLADVGGLADVKKRLQTSFLGPMRNPELRRMYGKSLRGGLLLYGPPGCGKTFLARAVAGELGARFFGIGLHDVLDMWLGKSEQNLHGIFETARRHTPCVLFLDEIDALGMKRSNLAHSAGRNVVVQLLNELDSTRADNEGIFVLGATNQPWDIDPALRRPGRFDRTLLVLPPDAAARRSILDYHLGNRPLDTKVKLDPIVDRTDGYSGADLRLLCEGAAEYALEDSLSSGTARTIVQKDLERATKDVRPSTRPWFETAKNYAMFANDGGAYDDLLAYMRSHRML